MDWIALVGEAVAAERPVAMATVVEAPGRPELVGRRLLASQDGALGDDLGAGAVPGQGAAPGAGPGPQPDESPGARDLADQLLQAAQAALSGGRPGTVRVAGLRVYIEPFLPPSHLIVAGGGHVAQPTAQIGKLLGFQVTVIDDRPEWANPARFPMADRVICDAFIPALRSLYPGPRHFVVLVTRGHRYDMDCLRDLIKVPVAYIGMIGSRTRVETVFRLLQEEEGIDPAHFEKVYAPIGLDVGARSPAEIAVAIGAELVKVRHGGTGESLSRLNRASVHGWRRGADRE